MPKYDPKTIEPQWQKTWLKNKTFKAVGPGEEGFDASKPKYYALDMFPYPSGAGLHVGHPEGFTATDILCRYKRMKGFNVLHPMGWDSFGLPAEQYAVKTGQHPAMTTKKNIDHFREQLQALGFSYDWDREIATSDPGYYRWTQWIFRKLYEKGLAYQAEVAVWWCEALGTVLANEEVDSEGKSEMGGHPCERKNMRQWMLRITDYAQRLLDDLEGLDWPHGIKRMQEEWIGRSEGADVRFEIADGEAQGEALWVFTTRPDTLYGATYMVLSPEHPLIDKLVSENQKDAVNGYRAAASRKSERDRLMDSKEKTGVFTGQNAINPVTGKEIPVWVADYVLSTYGTGAIMAVPAHDARDHDFAEAMSLPMIEVVKPKGNKKVEGCFTGQGIVLNSGSLDGMETAEAKKQIIAQLEKKSQGKKVVRYKLRDWLFSRQRYWGEPFPLVFKEDGSSELVPAQDLPITLPEVEDYKPTGTFEPPLSKVEAWVQTDAGRRETNVMPQWAGSCWYFLRFVDPKNTQEPWAAQKEKYWMPVDMYIGGAEHAVLHLLYARFWHKVFFDLGLVSSSEPFKTLFNQGMIIGNAYKTKTGSVVPTADLKWEGGKPHHPETGEKLNIVQAKMSKSLGNVINPDDVVNQYGADSFRLYEMFMGPLDAGKVWDTNAISGVYRFCKRAFTLIAGEDEKDNLDQKILPWLENDNAEADVEIEKALHRCIKQVSRDIEALRFNTAISAMMTFLNAAAGKALTRKQAHHFVKILSPFAPHLGEELWQRLGNTQSLVYEPWPGWDEKLCVDNEVEVVLQINGKVKTKIMAARDLDKAALEKLAQKNEKIQTLIEGKVMRKVIVVPGKLVNFVV